MRARLLRGTRVDAISHGGCFLRLASLASWRTDVVATPARSKAADPSKDVVTQNGATREKGEISRAACCHRSRLEGVASVCASGGRDDSRREEASDTKARRADEDVAAEQDRARDVVGVVSNCGPSPRSEARGARGAGDVGQAARRRRARCEDRSAGRTEAERGVVQDRPAVGAHPDEGGTRAPLHAPESGSARDLADPSS